jgi:hypothetical protein
VGGGGEQPHTWPRPSHRSRLKSARAWNASEIKETTARKSACQMNCRRDLEGPLNNWGVTVPHRAKSGTVKDKVVFITHRGPTHITQALKARKPLSAAHVNGKAMNTKTKPEEDPDLCNI